MRPRSLFFACITLLFLFSGISSISAQTVSRAKAVSAARKDKISPLQKIESVEYTHMADGTPCWKVSEKINLRKCYRNVHTGMNRFSAHVLYISAANGTVLHRDKEFRGAAHVNPSF